MGETNVILLIKNMLTHIINHGETKCALTFKANGLVQVHLNNDILQNIGHLNLDRSQTIGHIKDILTYTPK